MGKVRGRRHKEKNSEFEGVPDLKIYDNFEEQKQTAGSKNSNEPNTFFGLVDATELDYFKQAESTLNANVFESDEDRAGFVTSVLEEAKGKELKLVTNQICSKLMERLILNCNDQQLKAIFKSFNGFFNSLIHQKYSSHVVETLLVRSAALIEKELLSPFPDYDNGEEEYVSMENLFLFFLGELKPFYKDMIMHQYSSHTLRLIILILASKELPSSVKSNSTLRSKRSKIARKMIEIKDNDDFNKSFQVPSSFKMELKDLIENLRNSMDAKSAREYAIHKVASPVLQLLIQIEGIVDKDRSIWHLIFLKEDEPKDPKEESFVEYLLSDSVGSHFLQNCVKFERVKYIERLYRLYMKDRVLKLAKRDTTGSYVIQELLTKLKPKEVNEILDQLIPEMSVLMNTNLEIGESLITASQLNKNYKKDVIIQELIKKYKPNNESKILETILNLENSTLGNTKDDWPTAEERRKSLFLEQLIDYDEEFLNLTVDNLLELSTERLIQMCCHGVFSHVIESILKPELDIIKRRRILNQFMGSISDLACNAYGSHIVDKFWDFTIKLNNYKERIANELLSNKDKVKESIYGRLVWKNWSMELFVRKRHDWTFNIKQKEFEMFPNDQPKRKIEPEKNNRNSTNEKPKKKLKGRNRK